MKLSHLYADLGTQFSRLTLPQKPKQPRLLFWNDALANKLGLDFNEDEKAAYFSGQQILLGSKPVAMAYSGHQFGHFNPQLGDGRAHLLGEIHDANGQIQELQLKGSGQTPFSRNGDGKCGIKPAVREYVMSEAMHALGVPTTRCLSVVTTGEDIFRQTSTPAAVVTRVAKSHIRVGTFEYFAARKMKPEIKILADLTIKRHYPEIDPSDESKYLKLLTQVIDNQILLIVEWMRIGFIHGVMNTDNTLLSGATIDYGPCAMLGVYEPTTVFSSIDHQGRYAFGNQANIAQWNMARLAECMLSLVAEDEQQAIKLVLPELEKFTEKYNHAFNQMMATKLGFKQVSNEVNKLQQTLLELMLKQQLDYTKTFEQITNSLPITDNQTDLFHPNKALVEWHRQWLNQMSDFNINPTDAMQLMQRNNPLVIPRNHHIENVLDETESQLTPDSTESFLAVLKSPYSKTVDTHLFQDTSSDDDLNYQTYCGT